MYSIIFYYLNEENLEVSYQQKSRQKLSFFFMLAIYLISKYIYLTYLFTQKIFNF